VTSDYNKISQSVREWEERQQKFDEKGRQLEEDTGKIIYCFLDWKTGETRATKNHYNIFERQWKIYFFMMKLEVLRNSKTWWV
jgi:hypothetical protein